MHAKMSKTHAREVARLESTKTTNRMTSVELAKVFAATRGYYSQEGGWIYDRHDQPIIQGWQAFARMLQASGSIRVGTGINWRRTEHMGAVTHVDPRKAV